VELQDLAQKAYVSPFNFARIYIGLGETDKAFHWLETVVEEHDSMACLLPVIPFLNPSAPTRATAPAAQDES